MSTNKWKLFRQGTTMAALAVLSMAGLSGCGGGGGCTANCGGGGPPTPRSFPPPAAFVGHWVQVAGTGPVGTSFDIVSSGFVSGTLTPDPSSSSSQSEINSAVTGTCNSTPDSNVVLFGFTVVPSQPNVLASGTGSINGQGHLVVTLSEVGPPPNPSSPLTPLGTVHLDMILAPATAVKTQSQAITVSQILRAVKSDPTQGPSSDRKTG